MRAINPTRGTNSKFQILNSSLPSEYVPLPARVRAAVPLAVVVAALATAGGLVIGGDWDRHIYAYDAATGKILWQTRLITSAQGFPITYLAKGKQYIAMPAGTGGGSWSTLIPSELAPEIRQPKSGNAILVFALP